MEYSHEVANHRVELEGMARVEKKPPDNDDNSKHWYESKTMWFNGILGVLAIIFKVVDPLLPSLEQYMTAENFALLLACVNLINAVLRKYTHQAIKGGVRE